MNSDADRVAGARMPMAVSEAALLLVHLSVVGGFARLYEDGSFVAPLAGFTIGAHVLAVVTRRRRVPALLVLVLAVVGAGLAASWLLFPSSLRLGQPTGDTWDLAGEALRGSRDRFERMAAPAPVIPGFQLAAGLALWAAVWFADWAAFRLRATIEAMAPATVLFVFGAMLGSGAHRFVTTLAFAAAALGFVASHRALRAQLDQAWLTTSPVAGPRAVLRAGAGLAVLGLVGGAVVGPRLPGSEAEAVVRWRSEIRSGDRTTVSPIVDLRKRLVNQSDTVLFTVRAQRKSYWRLTSLDRFDGQLWSSGGTFSAAAGGLGSTSPDLDESRRNRQEFRIDALSAIWVPTAYQARQLVESTDSLRWDPASSTLIVEADTTSDGLGYSVVSEVPILEPADLVRAGSNDAAGIEERYQGLPNDFPRVASDAAHAVTSGATNRYEQAIALQDWFRSEFTYSLEVEAGNGDDALVDFLDSREGYCEQFAGTYAAMARALGIPSRVAVGFTPGDADPDDPDLYTVRGKHAHAWPELWFPDVGWVLFEPTPGRGLPDAEAYTGVPEQQDESDPEITIQPSTTTTVTGGSTSVPAATPPQDTIPRNPTVIAGAEQGGGHDRSSLATALIGVAVVVFLWLAALLAAPAVRARRRRTGGRSASAVLDAWHEGLAPVRWLTGMRPRPAETHLEFSRRAAPPLGVLDRELTELAALATSASWDPAGASPSQAERAGSLARSLVDEARRRQGRLARLRRRLSWREAFGLSKAPAPA